VRGKGDDSGQDGDLNEANEVRKDVEGGEVNEVGEGSEKGDVGKGGEFNEVDEVGEDGEDSEEGDVGEGVVDYKVEEGPLEDVGLDDSEEELCEDRGDDFWMEDTPRRKYC